MNRLTAPLDALLDALPIRDISDRLHETVLSPLQDTLAQPVATTLEAVVHKLADLSLSTTSDSSPAIIPPFNPDQDRRSPYAPEARVLLARLRAEVGRNVPPADKQNRMQDPRSPENRARKMADFAAVCARVDWAAVASTAEAVAARAGLANKYRGPVAVGEPLFGSMSACFPLVWEGCGGDGRRGRGKGRGGERDKEKEKWLLKIPINGTPGLWKPQDQRALASEVGTMRWLRRELGVKTNMHIPRVYDWDDGVGIGKEDDGNSEEGSKKKEKNRIGVPYIMMQYVEGLSAHDAWFTRWDRVGWWRPEAEDLRRGILSHVAAAMSELGRFDFDSGGAPRYEFSRDRRTGRETEDLLGVGPLRTLDAEAMLDRWLCRLSPEDKEKCERTPIYRELGPWKGKDAVKNFYTSRLDVQNVPEDSDFGGAILLKHYLKWWDESEAALRVGFDDDQSDEDDDYKEPPSPREKKRRKKPFVLTHPDLSLHNIIIDPQGKLYFIGWSGVACVPRAIGSEALPLWLVRDWNPFVYRWRDMDWPWRYQHAPWSVPVPEENRTEESASKLSGWRKYYAECMSEAKRAWRDAEKGFEEKKLQEQEARKKEAEELALKRAKLFSPKDVNSESDEEERRGRPRYRFGEGPPRKSKRKPPPPPPPPEEKPVRHVSFAEDTLPAPLDRISHSKSFSLSGGSKPCPRLNRTLLSVLPLSLHIAASDPRSRPFILQELYHRAVPSVQRWNNFEVSRLRQLTGGGTQNIPRPFEIEARELFYRMLLDCAGVPRGRHRPWAARLGDYDD